MSPSRETRESNKEFAHITPGLSCEAAAAVTIAGPVCSNPSFGGSPRLMSIEEGGHHVNKLVGLFIERHVAALFKEDEL